MKKGKLVFLIFVKPQYSKSVSSDSHWEILRSLEIFLKKYKLLNMNLLLRISCCILIAMCFQKETIAQVIKVTGKITNQKTGEPLAGATVGIKGADIASVVADKSGDFTITVPKANTILIFSYVGMATQEIKVTQAGSISINMMEKIALKAG